MYFYNYNSHLAKQKKCQYSYAKMFILVTLSVLFFTLLIILGAFADNGAILTISVIIGVIALISTITYCCNDKAIYDNARRVIFVFEGNTLYRVFFLGAGAMVGAGGIGSVAALAFNAMNEADCRRDAQNKNIIYQAIQQHKMGNSTFNKFTGSGTQVFEMHNISVLKETDKYWKCQYYDESNKLRKTTIVKAYQNFDIKYFCNRV